MKITNQISRYEDIKYELLNTFDTVISPYGHDELQVFPRKQGKWEYPPITFSDFDDVELLIETFRWHGHCGAEKLWRGTKGGFMVAMSRYKATKEFLEGGERR